MRKALPNQVGLQRRLGWQSVSETLRDGLKQFRLTRSRTQRFSLRFLGIGINDVDCPSRDANLVFAGLFHKAKLNQV